MLKHALMLTVATVALTAGSAAYADTTITTTKTAAQTTSADGNIILGTSTTSGSTTTTTNGYVTVTIANPAVEINSANYLSIATPGSTISNIGTTGAIGVQLDAIAAGNGIAPGAGIGTNNNDALYNLGRIDLTGTGTGKTGILVTPTDGSATANFNGNIELGSASSLAVTGDNSYGLLVKSTAIFNGSIDLAGAVILNPTSLTATTGGNVTSVRVDGTMNGNFFIDTTGSVQAYGAGATGVVITGPLNGYFWNKGAITSEGAQTPSNTLTNPEAGSAVLIANSISGGFYNDGPLTTNSSTTRATITTFGAAPAVNIATGAAGATATPITIGTYAGSGNTFSSGADYSFVNRGTIQARPQNNNVNGAFGVNIAGASGDPTTLTGGLYNAGTINSLATTDSKSTQQITTGAIILGNYANVPLLVNNQAESGGGTISASVSGAYSANAVGISINANATLPALINNGGSIVASVATTDTSIKNPANSGGTVYPGLSAYAIQDLSGTLTNIQNIGGTIAATATKLDDNSQVTVALDLSHASSSITINNTGTITGDVLLGTGADNITVNGTGTNTAKITGNIGLGGTLGTGPSTFDQLNIGTSGFGSVTGAVYEANGGVANVSVGTGGSLILTNTSQGALAVNNFSVGSGATLGLPVSSYFDINSTNYQGSPLIKGVGASSSIYLDPNSKFSLTFQSFITPSASGTTSQFVLLQAPHGNLTIGNYSTVINSISATGTNSTRVPFLYTGAFCTYNVTGSPIDCGTSGLSTTAPSGGESELVLSLAPKTAAQLGLSGNSATIFSYANKALSTDNTLGGAFVTDITNSAQAQAAYEAFVPDVSGSSRAVLISITDQASGPVGARQRALRTYANKDGSTTMWGQEFFQRINSSTNVDGYKGSGFGLALGIDSGSPRAGRYGAAITIFSGDQTNKTTNFAKTNNQWYMLTGYTDWRGKGVFFDTQLSVGYGNLDGKRYIQLTDPTTSAVYTRTAEGKRGGLALAGGFSSGVILAYGGTVITPQVSVDGLTMREEGYSEINGGSGTTGQDGFDLKVQPYYGSSARGYFGTTVRQDISFAGVFVQPELRAGYRYDFLAKAVKLKAAFLANTADSFTLAGPDPEKGDVVAGGSLSVSTGTWSLGVNFDYIRGTHGAVNQTGTITLLGRI